MFDPPVGLILSESESWHMVMNSKHLLHYPKERENFRELSAWFMGSSSFNPLLPLLLRSLCEERLSTWFGSTGLLLPSVDELARDNKGVQGRLTVNLWDPVLNDGVEWRLPPGYSMILSNGSPVVSDGRGLLLKTYLSLVLKFLWLKTYLAVKEQYHRSN